MAEQPIIVSIEEPDDSTRVDPATGTIEVDQPDGGVVVYLDAKRQDEDDGDENRFYANLCDKLGDGKLAQIANDLIEQIEADDSSRSEHLEILARGIKLLGLKLEEPKTTVGDSASVTDGMATVSNPLLLEAILRGWANASGELLPSAGPVKIQDDGQGTVPENELAEALERDMNHYLTKGAPEYYPETSHMLLWGTYLGGAGFKKIYRCPMRRRPVSENVDINDLIVSNTAKDLRSCSRITHKIMMRPSVVKRMVHIGAYRDFQLTQPSPQASALNTAVAGVQGTHPFPKRPEDQPYTIWETQCELDLDEFAPASFRGEGIPLPYLVSLDKDSRTILSIRRDWVEDDEQAHRRRMYVRYPYVPGPGFYCTGMLNILGNASAAMTAAWREALDAGMYANFPSGLIAKLSARQNTQDFRLAPGNFQPIETNGLPIGQVVMGLPYKDVTPGLLGLIDKITSQAQSLGGAADIPSAEGIQNVPVGTMLAQIEQATKVIAAAHKGMHQAQSEEFDILLDLFREHPEDFWRDNKVCPKNYWDEQKFLLALQQCNLVPVSDPNVPSHIHRISKALALVQLIALPAFAARIDAGEALNRILNALREDPRGLVIDPTPQGGPSLFEQAKMVDAQSKVAGVQQKAQETQARGQQKMAELAAQKDIETVRMAKELIIHNDTQRQNAHQRGLDMRQHGLDMQGQAMDAQNAARSHALDVAKAMEDARANQRQHALDALALQHEMSQPPPGGGKP